jgi:signal transduction histidine kinase
MMPSGGKPGEGGMAEDGARRGAGLWAAAAADPSSAVLERLAGGLPDGIILSRAGRVRFANQASAALLGCATAEEVVGRPLADFLEGLEGAASAPPGAPVRRQWHLARPDGGITTIEGSVSGVAPGDGVEAELILVLRDVSDWKRLQARLMQADRLTAIGTLAAAVAHEVNNPLAVTIAGLEFVAAELRSLAGELPPGRLSEVAAALAEARDGADRVRQTVRDLKTFARADDEAAGLLDVQRVIESAIRLAYNEIRHRARLIKEYHPAPLVAGNAARLGQVVVNLLVNAAQAIPEGDVAGNQIRIVTGTDPAGEAVIEVHDTGVGIPVDARQRIFDPFFTTKPAGVGTGLGLAICQSIVGTLGGTINVASEPGRGTVFRVVLPAARESAAESAAAPPDAPEPVTPRRGRILAIDDEPSVGLAVRRALRPAHDVVVATSARAALARLAAGERYDLILCDVMMPEMDGPELYAHLARDLPDQAARMVFLTGGAFTEHARRFLDQVANPRVEKPFESGCLRALVNSLLEPAPPPVAAV